MNKKTEKQTEANETVATPVIKILEDREWDYRSAESISEETGLDIGAVNQFLNGDERVLKSVMKGPHNRELYTLRSRKGRLNDLFSAFQALNADKLRSWNGNWN